MAPKPRTTLSSIFILHLNPILKLYFGHIWAYLWPPPQLRTNHLTLTESEKPSAKFVELDEINSYVTYQYLF
jgi:hypothetical protein